MKYSSVLIVIPLLAASIAQAGSPAARVGDPGQPEFHALSEIVSGSPDVRINGIAAATLGSLTTCPQECLLEVLPPVLIPHSAGIINTGSPTVLINGLPAARFGDMIHEAGTPLSCQPSHSVSHGSPNVLIGP